MRNIKTGDFHMSKKYLILASFLGLYSLCSAGDGSPWDNGQEELKYSVKCPIEYKTVFTREREMFGYKPRFMPGIVNFTGKNSPVIRCGVNPPAKPGDNHASFPKGFFSENNFIQYLNAEGKWIASQNHIEAIRKYLKLKPQEELLLSAGERCSDAVEIDKDNNAYTLVSTRYFKNGHRFFSSFLLYSNDNLKSWQVYPLKGRNLRLEPYRPNSDRSKPPVLTANLSGISLILPEKTKSGGLKIPASIQLVPESAKAITTNTMAGAGNQCISSKDKIFVVYMSQKALTNEKGTPQYIVSYNRRTGKVSGPVLLGISGHRIDGHNSPVVDLDSKGYVHVIGGTHWHGVPLWTSLKPDSITSGWSKPEYIAGNGDSTYSLSGVSYPGFLISRDGTMHLVVRGRSSVLEKQSVSNQKVIDYALVYFRKLPGKEWEKRKDLVVPNWTRYSNWYHKIGIDLEGNIYLTYYYIALRLEQVPAAQEEYCKKWENEFAGGKKFSPKDVLAHDPVIISSENNGKTWKIVRTQDFINKILK
jgi:hypothetical protein